MNIASAQFNVGSIAATQRIRQKVSNGTYKVIGMGYLDTKPAYFGDYQTFFVKISDGFGLFLFHPGISPENIRERIQKDIATTRFLERKRREKLFHPIAEPVQILTCGGADAPYICKSMPGQAGFPFTKEDTHAIQVFRLFVEFITDNLSDLKVSANKTYDIHPDNVVLNDSFIELVNSSRDREKQIDEWSYLPECVNERKILMDEWAFKGARIYLFDFGTWILPE